MKITKKALKQLIKEELLSEGVDPLKMLQALCVSETIGQKMLKEMMEAALEDPTNLLIVLEPWKAQIESVINMSLEDAVNTALDREVPVPMAGAMSLRKALALAAKNKMVKRMMAGMIPTALKMACQGAEQMQESKKLTNTALKQLVKEELRAKLLRDVHCERDDRA